MIRMWAWAAILLAGAPGAASAMQNVGHDDVAEQAQQTLLIRQLREERAETVMEQAQALSARIEGDRELASLRDAADCASTSQRVNWIEAFNQGNLRARECAIRLLQGDTYQAPGYSVTKQHVGMLENFYSRRAQRQQTFMDVGSLVTIVGAAGAFEGGLSTTTRRSWVIAGVLPSVIGRFNTYEPTRELFQGGALAVHLITLRQDRFNRALDLLGTPTLISCNAFDQSLQAVNSGRILSAENAKAADVLKALAASTPTDQLKKDSVDAAATAKATLFDPDSILFAEVRRLRNTCYAMKRRAISVRAATDAATIQQSSLAIDFANDVLSLDRALIAKDRDLRYTPIETLTAVVASPLRALDALVSGEDSKVALDSLKTQIAFSGINRSLASIPLPALASTAEAFVALEPLSVEATMLNGGDRLRAEIENLRQAVEVLAFDQQTLMYRERWAADLFGAAQADYLSFTYDVATGTTTVSLAALPAQVSITGTTAKP